MTTDLEMRLSDRSARAAAAIEICEAGRTELIPALIEALDQMTWGEVEQIAPVLPALGAAIVEPLCGLLVSSRKQAIEAGVEAGDVCPTARLGMGLGWNLGPVAPTIVEILVG